MRAEAGMRTGSRFENGKKYGNGERDRNGRKRMKRPARLLLAVLAAALCYIAAGAVLPFVRQPEVTAETMARFEEKEFYAEAPGTERAAVLSDNVDALAERIRLISRAQERIILSTFEFRNDESGKDIMAALLAAADRGVQVQILVDGMPAFKNLQLPSDPYFQALSSHANIELAIYNPVNPLEPWKLMGRLHDKYLIADDTAYILGGRNTYDFFLGDYGNYKNYDWDVLVYSEEPGQGESMNALLDYFTQVWELPLCRLWKDDPALQSGKRVTQAREALERRYLSLQERFPDWFAPCDYMEMTREVSHIELLSNPIHCYAKEPVVYYEMTELMKRAEGEVRFHTPYIICNGWMLQRLAEVCDSVDDVVMMTNSAANNGNPFGAMDYRKYRSEILETGVGILEYDGGVSYHGKCFVIDDRLSGIGSFNWDMRSAYLDTELMLVIDSVQLNEDLRAGMAEYEEKTLTVVDEDTVLVPEGMTAQKSGFPDRLLNGILSFFAGWARFLM